MGVNLGRKHLRDSSSTWPIASREEQEEQLRGSFWRRTRYSRDFENGYNEPWVLLGQADAADGTCRAKQYRNHSYNLGWTGEVERRFMRGWAHAALAQELEVMNRLYMKGIAKGTSDAYYDSQQKRT
jgi:hypothetical protein